MPSFRRWSVVAAGVAVLVSLPYLIAHRPVAGSSVSASDLLARIQRSGAIGYSGYAEANGGLALPVTNQISEVADLLGGRTQARVWYRGAQDWRVDTLSVFGETDVYRDDTGMWTWEYERARAVRSGLNDFAVRLPQTLDVLPTELARRLLSEATPTEATRLASRAVAGIDAPGLRIRPEQPQSSIDRVDVWADPKTGLPLRVEVYGKAAASPAMSTAFLDVTIATPGPSTTAFAPPDLARVRTDDGFDPLSATNQFAQVQPPDELAGITRTDRSGTPGAVGVYGRAVTELIAVPLRGNVGRSLRTQIENITQNASTSSLTVGPLNLLLTRDAGGIDWLLVGTVTLDTLKTAGTQLAAQNGRR